MRQEPGLPNVVQEELENPAMYDINGISPSAVYVRTEAEATKPGYAGVYPFMVRFHHHYVYAVFDQDPATVGEKATVNVKPLLTDANRELEFSSSDLDILNPHLHINQEGYFPKVPSKRAYFGAWMGTGGALDVPDNLSCFVHDAEWDTYSLYLTIFLDGIKNIFSFLSFEIRIHSHY